MRELLHRHRELCERAVDPLEIAAVLEAHGVTDRVAARFRHRDVFSLAEELFARVPRAEGGPSGRSAARAGHVRYSCATAARPGAPGRVLLALLRVLPGVVAAAGIAVLVSAGAGQGQGFGLAGVRAAAGAVGLGLVCALLPAVPCARWFAVRALRRLELSRSLAEFAAGTRPSLVVAVVLFTGALAGLQAGLRFASREFAAFGGVRGGSPDGVPAGEAMLVVTALGVLLFVALLLVLHGFRRTAAAGLAAACALQAVAGAVVLSGAVGSAGSAGSAVAGVSAATLVAAACGCAALSLLACAYRLLAGASAHHPPNAAARLWPPAEAGDRGRPEGCDHCERCASPVVHVVQDGRDGRDGRDAWACHDDHAADGHAHDGHACDDGRAPRECCEAPHGTAP